MQSPDVFEILDSLLVVDKSLNRSRFCSLHAFKGAVDDLLSNMGEHTVSPVEIR